MQFAIAGVRVEAANVAQTFAGTWGRASGAATNYYHCHRSKTLTGRRTFVRVSPANTYCNSRTYLK